MISAPIELIQKVRLMDNKVAGVQDNELPPNLVSRQKDALDKVRQALAGNGWVVEEKEGESALYQVAIDENGNYEICKGMPIPNLRPLLPIDDPTAPKTVVDRLVHLAKYQAVQTLDNSSSTLASLIDVELVKADGTAFDNPQNPTVKDGEIVILRLKNNGDQPLKVAVLDIEPTWAVSQVAIKKQLSSFYNLEGGTDKPTEIKLKMGVPDDPAYKQTTEILKVFAVQNGLADFRWLTLPPLDKPPENKRGLSDEALKGEATRSLGKAEKINPLNNLLKIIGADVEQAPQVTRSAMPVDDPEDEWVTKQIQITVQRVQK